MLKKSCWRKTKIPQKERSSSATSTLKASSDKIIQNIQTAGRLKKGSIKRPDIFRFRWLLCNLTLHQRFDWAPWKFQASTRPNVAQFKNRHLHLFSWACHGKFTAHPCFKISHFNFILFIVDISRSNCFFFTWRAKSLISFPKLRCLYLFSNVKYLPSAKLGALNCFS